MFFSNQAIDNKQMKKKEPSYEFCLTVEKYCAYYTFKTGVEWTPLLASYEQPYIISFEQTYKSIAHLSTFNRQRRRYELVICC